MYPTLNIKFPLLQVGFIVFVFNDRRPKSSRANTHAQRAQKSREYVRIAFVCSLVNVTGLSSGRLRSFDCSPPLASRLSGQTSYILCIDITILCEMETFSSVLKSWNLTFFNGVYFNLYKINQLVYEALVLGTLISCTFAIKRTQLTWLTLNSTSPARCGCK